MQEYSEEAELKSISEMNSLMISDIRSTVKELTDKIMMVTEDFSKVLEFAGWWWVSVTWDLFGVYCLTIRESFDDVFTWGRL